MDTEDRSTFVKLHDEMNTCGRSPSQCYDHQKQRIFSEIHSLCRISSRCIEGILVGAGAVSPLLSPVLGDVPASEYRKLSHQTTPRMSCTAVWPSNNPPI